MVPLIDATPASSLSALPPTMPDNTIMTIQVNKQGTVILLLLLCGIAAPMNISLTIAVWESHAPLLPRLFGTMASLLLLLTLLLVPLFYRTSKYTIEVETVARIIRKKFSDSRRSITIDLNNHGALWVGHHGGGRKLGAYYLKAADAKGQTLLFTSLSGNKVIAMAERIASATGLPLTIRT